MSMQQILGWNQFPNIWLMHSSDQTRLLYTVFVCPYFNKKNFPVKRWKRRNVFKLTMEGMMMMRLEVQEFHAVERSITVFFYVIAFDVAVETIKHMLFYDDAASTKWSYSISFFLWILLPLLCMLWLTFMLMFIFISLLIDIKQGKIPTWRAWDSDQSGAELLGIVIF